MNVFAQDRKELGPLGRYVDDVMNSAATDAESASAQERLMESLGNTGSSTGTSAVAPFRWRWAAVAAAVAVVAVTMVPLMPGGRDGVAFAEVQRRFETFDTMHVRMTTQVTGLDAMTMNILVDGENRTRLDAGDHFSYVIDPNAGVMLQLFHATRTAMRINLENGAEVPEQASMRWLRDIRSFQGEARQMPGRETINGRAVLGFALEAGGQEMVLWATGDGEPVRLDIQHAANEDSKSLTRLDFRFDEPVADGSFSLRAPPGYTIVGREKDAG